MSLGSLRSRLVRFSSASGNQSSCIGSPGAEGSNYNVLANSIENGKWSTESFNVFNGKCVFGPKWKACSQAITAT